MPDEWVRDAIGTFPLDARHYDRAFGGSPVDVLKPDWSLLFAYRPRELPWATCKLAWPALLRVAKPTDTRPTAAGGARVFRSGAVGHFRGRPTWATRHDPAGWAA